RQARTHFPRSYRKQMTEHTPPEREDDRIEICRPPGIRRLHVETRTVDLLEFQARMAAVDQTVEVDVAKLCAGLQAKRGSRRLDDHLAALSRDDETDETQRSAQRLEDAPRGRSAGCGELQAADHRVHGIADDAPGRPAVHSQTEQIVVTLGLG